MSDPVSWLLHQHYFLAFMTDEEHYYLMVVLFEVPMASDGEHLAFSLSPSTKLCCLLSR
jgi:hypothetical protein